MHWYRRLVKNTDTTTVSSAADHDADTGVKVATEMTLIFGFAAAVWLVAEQVLTCGQAVHGPGRGADSFAQTIERPCEVAGTGLGRASSHRRPRPVPAIAARPALLTHTRRAAASPPAPPGRRGVEQRGVGAPPAWDGVGQAA